MENTQNESIENQLLTTLPVVNAKLATAYAKAQGSFRTPKLNRTARVTKEGRLLYETHYADLQECIDCIKKPLADNGLSFFQTTQSRGGNWYLVLELLHESGQKKETYLPINVNQTNQQLGGTMTYLKRYQLSAFFGLAADFDDDGNATEGNEVQFGDGKKSPQPQSKPKNYAPQSKPAPLPPKPPEDDLDAALGHPPDEPPLTGIELLMMVMDNHGITNEEMPGLIARVTGEKIRGADLSQEQIEKIIAYIQNFSKQGGKG